jgi:hypothetical protein
MPRLDPHPALSCPLSDEASLQATRGVLITIAGVLDVLYEVYDAASLSAGMALAEPSSCAACDRPHHWGLIP